MFTKEVVGTANALVGGWGNLGGGVTQLVMGAALFPLFKSFYGGNAEKAWRKLVVIL
jgi:NNP family nitrate/nitrite transporter-like MFS transporter